MGAKYYCPECDEPISRFAAFCPSCGWDAEIERSFKVRRVLKWLFIIFIVIPLLFGFFVLPAFQYQGG